MHRRLRVLHVVPHLGPAGAETVATHLACGLDRSQFEPFVLSLYGPQTGGSEPRLHDAGVPVVHLNKRPGLDLGMMTAVWRVLKEIKPDVLHTHLRGLLYSYPAAMSLGLRPVIHTIHNVADREEDFLGRQFQRFCFGSQVTPVCISKIVAAGIEKMYGMKQSVCIPNGVPVRQFRDGHKNRLAFRSEFGINADEFLFVSVGRLDEAKDPVTLVHAFADATKGNEKARLWIAGEGSLRPSLESAISRLGVAERVRLLGVRKDIPKLLAAADAFVLASLWEGNPLAIMEAMAVGLAVIASPVGGVPELIEHGESGLLVQPGNAAELSRAIAELLNDPMKRERLGQAAASRAEERFDVSNMISGYERLYISVGTNRRVEAPDRAFPYGVSR